MTSSPGSRIDFRITLQAPAEPTVMKTSSAVKSRPVSLRSFLATASRTCG
jgi:hypothetical protein